MLRRSWPLLLALAGGCTGLLLDGPEGPAGPGGDGPSTFDPRDDDPGFDPDAVGPMPLRRLTAVEHAHVVRDLLGVRAIDGRPVTSYLGADPLPEQGFSTPGDVSDVSAASIRELSERLAREVDVAALAACASADEACARSFARDFGRRAYRRPLAEDELDAHVELYRALRGSAALDHVAAMHDLLAAMLQSPDFLYRWEIGDEEPVRGGAVALGAHSLASRLSFFLWRSMPDVELDAAADSGALRDPAELERQARRCSPTRARETRSRSSTASGCASARSTGRRATPRSTPRPARRSSPRCRARSTRSRASWCSRRARASRRC